ncbi:hypothetical protein SeLEV6574_g06904 [Synchytrium endobioticum]|uniref:HSF-type DNA-binding domain-containing protein n=1 Tax=Synchytrium endobioticum TaxID=286115 RepID=A0A507CMN2_9FUNG|nr:hypothetical protein SeLEV6574_g06904 [Synchytrium endobioticum]
MNSQQRFQAELSRSSPIPASNGLCPPVVSSTVFSATHQPLSFVQKLYTILEESQHRHLIHWDDSGTGFVIRDASEFAKTVLPNFFKHNNFASFVRQLHMYGFHRVNDNFHAMRSEVCEFNNPEFIRGNIEAINAMRRKINKANKSPKHTVGNIVTLTSPIIQAPPSLHLENNEVVPSISASTTPNDGKLRALADKVVELEGQMAMIYKNNQRLQRLLAFEQQHRMRNHRAIVHLAPRVAALDHERKRKHEDEEATTLQKSTLNTHSASSASALQPAAANEMGTAINNRLPPPLVHHLTNLPNDDDMPPAGATTSNPNLSCLNVREMAKERESAATGKGKEARRVTIAGTSGTSAIKNVKQRGAPIEPRSERFIVPTSLRKKLFGDILLRPAGSVGSPSMPGNLHFQRRPVTPIPLRFESIDSVIPPAKPLLVNRESRYDRPSTRIRNNDVEDEPVIAEDEGDDEDIEDSQDGDDGGDEDYEDTNANKRKGKKKATATKANTGTRSTRKKKTNGESKDSERERKILDAMEQVKNMLVQLEPLAELQIHKRKANFSELEKASKKLRKGIEQVTLNLIADLDDERAKKAQNDKIWRQAMMSIDEKEVEEREEAGAILRQCEEEVENAKTRTATYIQGWYDESKIKRGILAIATTGN